MPRRVQYASMRGVDCTAMLVSCMQLSTRNACMAMLLLFTRAEQNPEKYSTLQVDEKGQDPHTGSGVCVCVRARARPRAVVRMRQCLCVDACVRSERRLGNVVIHRGVGNIHSEGGRQQHPFLAELEKARTRASAALSPPPPPPPREHGAAASSLPNVGILRNVKMVRHICACVRPSMRACTCASAYVCTRATYSASIRVPWLICRCTW